MAREPVMKPDNRRTTLKNYLPERFTFYWDKEAYTLEPAGEEGDSLVLFRWLALHGAVKMAERYFHLNPQNKKSADPKTRGFYSRHEDFFKEKVQEAIIIPKDDKPHPNDVAAAVDLMNADEPKAKRKEIELKEADDAELSGPSCQECKATGPRHKPTCSNFKPHPTDVAQAAELQKAAS